MTARNRSEFMKTVIRANETWRGLDAGLSARDSDLTGKTGAIATKRPAQQSGESESTLAIRHESESSRPSIWTVA